MELSNISLGQGVQIDDTSSINNVRIADGVKIAKYCSVFGSKEHPLEIGKGSYVGMFSILNGYAAPLKIGAYVSIAQHVNMMTDSGPNASEMMQQLYPILKAPIVIEDHAWIGAGVIITPGVHIGRGSVVAANSLVSKDVPAGHLVGGNPAVIIKKLSIPDEL